MYELILIAYALLAKQNICYSPPLSTIVYAPSDGFSSCLAPFMCLYSANLPYTNNGFVCCIVYSDISELFLFCPYRAAGDYKHNVIGIFAAKLVHAPLHVAKTSCKSVFRHYAKADFVADDNQLCFISGRKA